MIVVFHGGAEGSDALHVPAGRELAFGEDRGDLRAFARTAVAAGADAVLGAGPHVVRGAEVVAGRPVAYSMGNLVGYRVLSTAGVLGITAMIQLALPRRTAAGSAGCSGRPGRCSPATRSPIPTGPRSPWYGGCRRRTSAPSAMRVGADGTLRPPV